MSGNGTGPPPVDVIILNYNRCDDTLQCIESVCALDYPTVRIVVCDNGSTDASDRRVAEWAASRGIVCAVLSREDAEQGGVAADAGIVVIQNGGNLGFAAGNNVGMRFAAASRSDAYVWLVNNDVVVLPDSLRHMVAVAEADSRVGMVGATILEFDEPDRVQEAGGGRLTRFPGFVTPNDAGRSREDAIGTLPLDYVSGACVLVRRAVIERIGILDERFFMYAEDIDWGHRARAAGFTLAYARAAEVRHKGSASTGRRSPVKDYHITRSTFLLGFKYGRRGLRPLATSVYVLALPKLVRGEWKRLGAVIRAYRDARRAAAELAGKKADLGGGRMHDGRPHVHVNNPRDGVLQESMTPTDSQDRVLPAATDLHAELIQDYGRRITRSVEDFSEGEYARTAKKLARLYRGRLPEDRNVRCLDVGCGDGHFLYFLKQQGYRNIQGIDASEDRLALCRKFVTPNVSRADAIDWLGEHRGAYDFISCHHVIEHIPDARLTTFVMALGQGLRPGGTLLLTTPNACTPWVGYNHSHDLTHLRLFTAQSLAQLLGFCDLTATFYPEGAVPFDTLSTLRWAAWKARELQLKIDFRIQIGGIRAETRVPLIVSPNFFAIVRRTGEPA
jgi:GT2 family glycosyltransferase/2-polyprenyl-3-methyl-5-hydroxy-6-metoxy-1,4-benzoquinol methylase